MNNYFTLILINVFQIIFTLCNGQEIQQNISESDYSLNYYFGQKPPGKVAEVFAPGELTFEPHDSPIISQDETWMVIGTMEQGVKFYKMNNGKLSLTTNPLKFDFPFNNIPYSFNGMEISHSENRIYFLVWINDEEDFYYIDKIEDGWSSPKPLGEELNTISTHWQFTVADNENLYLMVRKQGICVSKINGESYIKPVQLVLENGSNMEGGTPYIAHDESYIIYSLDDDLQISYKLSNGKWTIPQNLGSDINSDKQELCPRISPNGKYLFFISKRISNDYAVFWANAGFITELKPEELK